MSRIENITGTPQIEVMSPTTTMVWDPVTNGGHISFNMMKYVVVDDVIRTDIAPSQAGMLHSDLMSMITRRFVVAGSQNELGQDISLDPVTGADLSMISVAGVMHIIKAAFNTLYDESLIPPVEDEEVLP